MKSAGPGSCAGHYLNGDPSQNTKLRHASGASANGIMIISDYETGILFRMRPAITEPTIIPVCITLRIPSAFYYNKLVIQR